MMEPLTSRRILTMAPLQVYSEYVKVSSPAPKHRGGSVSKVEKTFPAGAVIFHEGDPGGDIYIIMSGEVKVYQARGGREIILAQHPGYDSSCGGEFQSDSCGES
jgi:CRP-like cAMP-binding protein